MHKAAAVPTDAKALIQYLGLDQQGPIELRTADKVGAFAGMKTALKAMTGAEQICVHPSTVPVTDQIDQPRLGAAPPTVFQNIALSFEDPDDPSTAVRFGESLALEQPGAMVWFDAAETTGYLVYGVLPFDMSLVHDLPEALNRLKDNLKTLFLVKGWDLNWSVTDVLPLSGRAAQIRDRQVSDKVRRELYRPIPQRVYDMITRSPNGPLAKAFGSRGRPSPITEKGESQPVTEATFDYQLVQWMAKSKAQFSKQEIVDTLWNRRPSPLFGDPKAIDEFVEKVCEETRLKSGTRPKAPHRPEVHISIGDNLREILFPMYYSFNENTQSHVNRTDYETKFKVDAVFQFLQVHGASFYHFTKSNEVLFLLDGKPHMVDYRDEDYASWFDEHVQLFTSQDARGKELTRGLRTKIKNWEGTKKGDSVWGRYDGVNEVMHLCFDPKHVNVVRVEAAEDGKANIRIQPNGTDDVTLRGMTHRLEETVFEYAPGQLDGPGWQHFMTHIHHGQSLQVEPVNYRVMSTIFNLCCVLPLHQHRPLKFHYGAPGSGKTEAAKDFVRILYGQAAAGHYVETVNLLKDMSDGGPITVQDNAESKDRWRFNQVYLVPASGLSTKFRKYFTDSDQRVFLPNGSLIVTAVEPMHRPEEIRRTFEFPFDITHRESWRAKERKDFTLRTSELSKVNNLMLSAILDLFSVRILPGFEARYANAIEWLNTRHDELYGTKKDYSDWYGRMLAMLEATHDLFDVEDARATFVDWMADVSRADAQSTVSGDSLMALLESVRNEGVIKMVQTEARTKFTDEPCNKAFVGELPVTRTIEMGVTVYHIGPCSANQLYATVAPIARKQGVYLEAKSARALGRRLAALKSKSAFALMGWECEALGRDRTANVETWMFRFTRPNQSPEQSPDD